MTYKMKGHELPGIKQKVSGPLKHDTNMVSSGIGPPIPPNAGGGGLVNPFAGVTPTNISGISQGGGATASIQPSMVPGMGSGGPAVSNNSPQGQAMMQQMMQQRRRRRRPNNPPPGTAYMPQMGPMATPLAKKKKK